MGVIRTTALAFAIGAAACGGPGAKAPGKVVAFRMRGQPASAMVTIDDQPIGPLEVVAKRGVALPVGPHRITVEANGYLPFDRIVTAEEKAVVLDVSLVPIPD